MPGAVLMAGGAVGDEGKDAGTTGIGRVRDGFNLDCGVPSTLLLATPSPGPWRLLKRTASTWAIVHLDGRVAWTGSTPGAHAAGLVCERMNGWEHAREFPPGGSARHQ